MNSVSFLLGSGFSVPAKFPRTGDLNARLSTIKESEIQIHSSLSARFLDGDTDPNAWFMHKEDRFFVESFLNFFNQSILKNAPFDYEEFWDFCESIASDSSQAAFNSFCDEFRMKNQVQRDNFNLIMDFRRTYSQLIADRLRKPLQHANTWLYEPFSEWVESFTETGQVSIFTLNHDRLWETVLDRAGLFSKYSDGFTDLGSEYYYDNDHGDLVKLPLFVNKFDGPINLFKLHGSIDTYRSRFLPGCPPIKMVRGASRHMITREFFDEKLQEVRREEAPRDVEPLFLTGRNSKAESYQQDPFYKVLFGHFQNNLNSTDRLVIIGYGFRDPGITDCLCKFADRRGTSCIVVDTQKPSHAFLERSNVTYIPKSAEQFSGSDLQ